MHTILTSTCVASIIVLQVIGCTNCVAHKHTTLCSLKYTRALVNPHDHTQQCSVLLHYQECNTLLHGGILIQKLDRKCWIAVKGPLFCSWITHFAQHMHPSVFGNCPFVQCLDFMILPFFIIHQLIKQQQCACVCWLGDGVVMLTFLVQCHSAHMVDGFDTFFPWLWSIIDQSFQMPAATVKPTWYNEVVEHVECIPTAFIQVAIHVQV